jgi:hypothetical protein
MAGARIRQSEKLIGPLQTEYPVNSPKPEQTPLSEILSQITSTTGDRSQLWREGVKIEKIGAMAIAARLPPALSPRDVQRESR